MGLFAFSFHNWDRIYKIPTCVLLGVLCLHLALCFAFPRIFSSNLKERMAQRFYNLVLLPRIRDDIAEYKRLNFHLYMALKKALFKPAAWFKGRGALLGRHSYLGASRHLEAQRGHMLHTTAQCDRTLSPAWHGPGKSVRRKRREGDGGSPPWWMRQLPNPQGPVCSIQEG